MYEHLCCHQICLLGIPPAKTTPVIGDGQKGKKAGEAGPGSHRRTWLTQCLVKHKVHRCTSKESTCHPGWTAVWKAKAWACHMSASLAAMDQAWSVTRLADSQSGECISWACQEEYEICRQQSSSRTAVKTAGAACPHSCWQALLAWVWPGGAQGLLQAALTSAGKPSLLSHRVDRHR